MAKMCLTRRREVSFFCSATSAPSAVRQPRVHAINAALQRALLYFHRQPWQETAFECAILSNMQRTVWQNLFLPVSALPQRCNTQVEVAQQLAQGSTAAGGTPEAGRSGSMQRQSSISYSRRMSLSARPHPPSSPRDQSASYGDLAGVDF